MPLFTDRDIENDLDIIEHDMTVPFVILICINILILAPITFYFCYNYYLLRDTYMYNARRPRLVMTVMMISIIYICVYIPLHISIFQLYWKNDNTYNEYWDSLFLYGAQMLVFMSYVLRTWHSFYDFKLGYEIAADKWKSILNAQYKGTSSIYEKYHKTLGQSQWTFKYLLIVPITIWFIAYTVIIAFKTGYDVEYIMIALSFVYVFIAIIWSVIIIIKTTTDINDNIYVRGEILFGCVTIVFAMFGQITVLLYDTIPGYTEANDQYQQVFYFTQYFIGTLSSFLLIVVSTQYIKFKVYQKNKQISKFDKHLSTSTHIKIHRKSTDMLIDFESLISTSTGLQVFLDHLANENQLNYLVFAIEVTQFKKDVRMHSKVIITDNTLLPFPEAMVPDSSIIFPYAASHTQKSYVKIYLELFSKYIDPNDAKWPVQLTKEHRNAAIDTNRRCKSKHYGPVTPVSDIRKHKCCSCFQIQIQSQYNSQNSYRFCSVEDNGDQKDQLQQFLDVLDDALTDSIKILSESFDKFKKTQEFITWLHNLESKTKVKMCEEFEKRKSVKEIKQKNENNKIVQQWICNQCTFQNKTIFVGNKEYPPKQCCNCCGYNNPLHVHNESKSEIEIEMKEMIPKTEN
eukprot:118384_1